MIARLIEHMHWANSNLIAWLEAGKKDSGELVRLASHILNVENVWICRARRIEHGRDTFIVHDFEGMSSLNDSNRRGFESLLREGPGREVDYRLMNGTPGRSRIEDMIIHSFSHGFHHVGQMASMVSKSEAKLPDLSYLGFIRAKS